jgi:D-alanyl-D-alanine carboxypeptidase (penicillin-binding protein 5/6)
MSQLSLTFQPQRKRRKIYFVSAGLLILAVALYFLVLRKEPTVTIQPEIQAIDTAQRQENATITNPVPWPKYGQSAVGVKGYGVLKTNQQNAKPVPMASLAKVITALAVLEKRPLNPGDSGPSIILNNQDLEFFNKQSSQNGTVTKVVPGQRISQYQALQALLVPSSNNMADTLADWAFGSNEEYVEFANNYVKQLGLANTYIADPSGFSPKNVSTASDLVLLGEQALSNPVIAEIVAQWEVNLPLAGLKYNTNRFLDYKNNGVIGIKSGETDEAGGTYLAAAEYIIDGKPIIIIAVVLGAPNHFAAQKDAMPLLLTASSGLNFVNY